MTPMDLSTLYVAAAVTLVVWTGLSFVFVWVLVNSTGSGGGR